MSGSAKCLVIFIVTILISNMAGAELPSKNIQIAGKGTRGPYLLGHKNIITNSVSIVRRGVVIDSNSYNIAYVEGIIWFDDVIPLDDTLSVSFQFLPVSLQSQYYLHEMKTGKAKDRGRKIGFEGSRATGESDITITGSKGFAIETGEGSDRLSQSLNLNIKGELIPGLRTSAHISDKSNNGGAVTKRLNELDKIYIEAESRYFKGIFGDYDYHETDLSMLSFQRKLTGLNLKYSKSGREIRGAAGFFPGEYRRLDIAGTDGRLGPYYLTDANGREGVPVLPGSERIYLDGELLLRGSEKDYTIDYESGAVQFAPSIVVRNESRITAEYEVSREEYSRSFFATAGEYQSFGRLTLFSKLIQEGDNGDSPKSFEMTSENRGLIEDAGSDPLGASKSGVTYRGPGEGDYDLAGDTLENQYFVYAGPDLGEYDVTFSYIGEEMGSYSPQGGGVFQYVGSGIGAYEPVILLPIPELKRYGTIGSSWISDDTSFNFYGEISGSLNDRNTISQIDNVEKGTSGAAKIDYSRNIMDTDAFAGFGIMSRKIGRGMIFPGRVDDVERYRDYDLDPETSPAGEWVGELNFKGGLDRDRNISFLWGDLTRPSIKERRRLKGSFDWRFTGMLRARGRSERVSGSRTWLKRNLDINASLEKIQPGIGVEYEKRDGEAGFKYYEYIGKLPATLSPNLKTVTEINYRDEKALETYWVDKFQSGYIKQSIDFAGGRSGLSGDVNGAYYRKKYKDQSGPDSDQKSGRARLVYSDAGERFELKINEGLSASNERVQGRNYIFVGEGNGEYRFEDGEYIRDPDGDYILVLEELGEGEKITEVSTELYGSVRPFMFADSKEDVEVALGRLVIESDLAYNQRKSGDRLIFSDFVPWKKDNLEDLAFRNGGLDLRVFYYPPSSKHRIKYSLVRSYEDGRRYANETSRDNLSSDEISWAFPAGKKVNVVLTGLFSKRERQINSVSTNIRRHKESISTEYRFHESWNLRFGAEYENVNERETGVISHIPSTNLALSRELGKRGRITANVSYFRMIVRPEGSYIPYQVAGGKREGDNFEGGIQARIEPIKNGRFELSYRFEKFSMRSERQNLRLNFTLLFL